MICRSCITSSVNSSEKGRGLSNRRKLFHRRFGVRFYLGRIILWCRMTRRDKFSRQTPTAEEVFAEPRAVLTCLELVAAIRSQITPCTSTGSRHARPVSYSFLPFLPFQCCTVLCPRSVSGNRAKSSNPLLCCTRQGVSLQDLPGMCFILSGMHDTK